MSQALTATPPRSLTELHARYAPGDYHLLFPLTTMSGVPSGTVLSVREITIDPQVDTYPLKGGKLSLSRVALDKIAAAAGISWIAVRRIDDRKTLWFCEFEVRARVIDFDGAVRETIATRHFDLRLDIDGEGTQSPDTVGMSEARLGMARKFQCGICESMAKNRAISSILGLRRAYDRRELSRPFVVPKLVPDTSHHLAQQMVLAAMCGATDALFGSRSEPAQLAAPVPEPEPEEPPDYDSSTGEVLDADIIGPAVEEPSLEEKQARLGNAWREGQRHGMDRAVWKDMIQDLCVPSKAEDMSEADVAAIERFIVGREETK